MKMCTELPESLEQCLAEVPKRFITGSVDGQFISSMKKLVQEIIPLALSNQFQEPKITNRISFELQHQGNSKTNQDAKSLTEFTYISRPSDFRIKSICRSMTLEFHDHVDDNFGGKTNNKIDNGTNANAKQQLNEQTIATASKSMCKLFDEFIADFSTSIDG